MKIRFASSNVHKIAEASQILAPEFEVVSVPIKIEELQTDDAYKLVRHKLHEAFRNVGRAIFVEHTGLYIDGMGGLPAGLTQIFWDRLQADKFARIVDSLENKVVHAKTLVAYCDGRSCYSFEGSISGSICSPRGNRDFQWDCVFIPDGKSQTFAEMGVFEKNKVSMRKLALDQMKSHIKDSLNK
jgi:XTP/dITP diphosphohydrolase